MGAEGIHWESRLHTVDTTTEIDTEGLGLLVTVACTVTILGGGGDSCVELLLWEKENRSSATTCVRWDCVPFVKDL